MNQNPYQQNRVDQHLMDDHQDAVWCALDEVEVIENKGTIEAEKTREKTITQVLSDL